MPDTNRATFGDPSRRLRWDAALGVHKIERRWTPDPDAIAASRARFQALCLRPDHPLKWQRTRAERFARSILRRTANVVCALVLGGAR